MSLASTRCLPSNRFFRPIEADLSQAIAWLKSGQILLCAAEGVLGLCASAARPDALKRLYWLKQRPVEKSFILVSGTQALLEGYVGPLALKDWAQIVEGGKANKSFVVPGAGEIPLPSVDTQKTIAVRLTQHPLLIALSTGIEAPLRSTSANLHGLPALNSAIGVCQQLKHCLLWLPSKTLPGCSGPSELVDLHTQKIIRHG